MKKAVISKIECEKSTNLPGNDDVFLMVQVDGGPPQRYPVFDTIQMDDGDEVSLPRSGEATAPTYFYKDTLSITVWDHDGPANWLNEADFLGSFGFDTTNVQGKANIWGVDSSEYKLSITITDAGADETANGSALPSDLQQAANDAIQKWANSDDGKKALNEDDPEKLSDIFSDGLASSIFDDVIKLVRNIPLLKAVSLGLMGQVEVFVGIDGAFGVAMDLDNFPNEWAIFAGGGLVEGVDAGIQGTIALGFWFEDTKDIGGFYVGAEVDIDEGLGVTAAAWAGRGDKSDFKGEEGINLKYAKVIFVGIDVGIDDGVEAEELYCLSGHFEDYPSFQTGTYDNLAMITKIHCDNKAADAGHDDVHLFWSVDGKSEKYRWPMWNDIEMDDDDDDDISAGTIIKFDEYFEIELYAQGDKVETQKYELKDFDGVGSDLKHKLDNDAGLFGEVEYHITARLMASNN